jgi:hypothetical protein
MGVYPVNSSLLFAIFIQLVVKRQLHECLIKNLEKIMVVELTEDRRVAIM